MKDYIVSAISLDGKLRAYGAITTELVKEAFKIHDTYPVVTAAFGRVLTGAAIMGSMLKGDKDVLTIQIKGDGPIGDILVTADSKANVKGYVNNPHVDLPLKEDGKLNVGKAVGNKGLLSIIKDIGLKDPYIGQVNLASGEIAEDLTLYFAKSEQVPSVVALGVLTDAKDIVKAAGGFIVQLMPDADENTINMVEDGLKGVPTVTQMISDGLNCEDMLTQVLPHFPLKILSRKETKYMCDCSKEKVEKALIAVGEKDLKVLIEEDKGAELSCHFCNNTYYFNENDLRNLLEK
jgi:molecular chaperone Hsp33